jgi:hypothetical protein
MTRRSNHQKNAATRPPIRLNQYGASFGGPIRKEKTFFFVTWERTGQLTSDTTTSTVPTALNRAGDFSDLLQLPSGSGASTPAGVGRI